MEDFIYILKEDSLRISVAPKAGPDDFLVIRVSSFLWNYKLKHSGIFIKQPNLFVN